MGSLKIGADPELFLKQGDKFVSGHNVIPGTKANPHIVKKGAVQVDGMALELNIEPASTDDEFYVNISSVLNHLRSMVPGNLELNINPVATFDKEYMAKQPAISKRLGCEPDYNAYTRAVNIPPKQHPTMRTAAGHVHLGWAEDVAPLDPEHFFECCDMAQQLDYYLGIPSMLMDSDNLRREMYGKAGCFRPKYYGMEYRTLSNFWVNNIDHMKWVFNSTQKAYEDYKNNICLYNEFPLLAQAIINTNNRPAAEKFCKEVGW